MEGMEKIDTKSNIFYFFIITLAYTIISQISSGKGFIWLIIYLLVVLAVQYYINLQLSKALCGSEQHGDVFTNTFLPWLLILCTTAIFIQIFPGWLRAFSNTLGYTAAKFAGADKLCKQIFVDSSNVSGNTDRKIVENIENIYNNPGQMINDIDLDETVEVEKVLKDSEGNPKRNADGSTQTIKKNVWGFWMRMKHAKLVNNDILNNENISDDFEEKLKKIVKLKDNIASFFWYLLSGILAIVVSENFILGSTCSKSIEDLEREHDEYLKNKNNNQKPDQSGSKTSGVEIS
tara:strand:- start:33793 stop:34665 length:873 start_codon:yes stop_codon:yes gene_type:complete